MWFKWSLFVLFLLIAFAEMNASRRSKNGQMTTTKKRHSKHHNNARNENWYPSKSDYFIKSIEPYEEPFVNEDVLEVTNNKLIEKANKKKLEEKIQEETIDAFEEEEEPEDLWDVDAFDCPSVMCSADLEMNKLNRITQIKEKIIKETGVDKSTNVSKAIISSNPILQGVISNLNNEHNEMHKVRHKNTSDDLSSEDDPDVKIEKMFIAAVEGAEQFTVPNGYDVLYFNLGKEHASVVHAAKLHVWLPPMDTEVAKDYVLISVLQVIEPATPENYIRLRNVYSDIIVPYNTTGKWVFMDVFSLVREWYQMPQNNSGFVLNITTTDGMKIEVDSPTDDPTHAPLLEVDVVEKRNERRKRFASIRKCENNRVKKYCCLYPLLISFTELAFDFVVAPKTFEANYCRGECPFLFAHKYPHSTIVQQIFKDSNTNSGRCCGARDLAPLTMLYHNGNKIQLTTLNDMVVKKCSCN